ncbi:acyltransferase family protein [Agaribacterium sp. ZY112]|uniref:acyltransferase family protein n=1 Tax=Agaribacterium sp. ZY112 TaxID=3233574 RepID=UPI0035252E79
MSFRKDINGLRAIAVIAVVLYHFNPIWLPGGFAGVDVFFVISGFLMTGIVFRGLENNRFSIVTFYVARANRIIPALAFLCLTLLVLGWFTFSAYDYAQLAKHVLSSVTFVSNMVYWGESGYFDAASHEKWLLHTWSLSAEWQFYMLYPIFLALFSRFVSLPTLKILVLIATVLGFLFCVVASYTSPLASYFLLPTRAWEMLIGGVAYLYPMSLKANHKRWFEVIGILMIVASYFSLSQYDAWPGYLALIPVLGAFLVVQANSNTSFLTGNVVFQHLGSWSYSIYLWHWPLVVVPMYFSVTSYWPLIGIPLSVLLGCLSYRFIESIRFSSLSHWASVYRSPPLYMVLGMALCSYLVVYSEGAMTRFSEADQLKARSALVAVDDWTYPMHGDLKVGESDIRFIEGSTDKNILFIGSSHIEHLYPYVASLDSEYNVYFLTMGGCFVAESFKNPKWSCSNVQGYKSLMEQVEFEKVVTSLYNINGYLSGDAEIATRQLKQRVREYDQFLAYVKTKVKQVVVLLGEPKGDEFDPKKSLRRDLAGFISVEQARSNYRVHYEALQSLQNLEGVMVIDPIDYLCTDVCKVMNKDYEYYYSDSNHLRPWYAIASLDFLDPVLTR